MNTLDFTPACIRAFQQWYTKSSCFSGPILCSRQNISASKSDGDALFLDRARLLKTLLIYPHQKLSSQEKVLEFNPFRVCDILRHDPTSVSLSGGPDQELQPSKTWQQEPTAVRIRVSLGGNFNFDFQSSSICSAVLTGKVCG